MKQVRVRSARADDANFLAWLLLTAGRAHVKRGIWEVLLDGPEDQCLSFLKRLAVTEIPHLFHYSCYLVAEIDDRPVAGLGGYNPTALGYSEVQKAIPGVLKALGGQVAGQLMPGESKRILQCVPADIEGAWIVDSVATLPEFRRKGLVNRLLEEILKKGRRQGFRLSQINLYIGNTPALRAYEKQGFRILDEKRDPYFETQIGSPGMVRLWRRL